VQICTESPVNPFLRKRKIKPAVEPAVVPALEHRLVRSNVKAPSIAAPIDLAETMKAMREAAIKENDGEQDI
jgi:hypothetical protein